MSILGLDLGRRRIGIAILDAPALGVRPLTTLYRRSSVHDLEALRSIVGDWRVDRIIMGLPLNMNGSEGAAARQTRAFAGLLSKVLGLPVELYDERLTSFEARSRLKEASQPRGTRKLMVDQVAAALILEGWLTEHGTDVA
jgi:putative holliday junction resolvase